MKENIDKCTHIEEKEKLKSKYEQKIWTRVKNNA